MINKEINSMIAGSLGLPTTQTRYRYRYRGLTGNWITSSGWGTHRAAIDDLIEQSKNGLGCNGIEEYEIEVRIPDFAGNLDACTQFEGRMTDDEWGGYMEHLIALTGARGASAPYLVYRALIAATPAHKTQAYLMVRGLWV